MAKNHPKKITSTDKTFALGNLMRRFYLINSNTQSVQIKDGVNYCYQLSKLCHHWIVGNSKPTINNNSLLLNIELASKCLPSAIPKPSSSCNQTDDNTNTYTQSKSFHRQAILFKNKQKNKARKQYDWNTSRINSPEEQPNLEKQNNRKVISFDEIPTAPYLVPKPSHPPALDISPPP